MSNSKPFQPVKLRNGNRVPNLLRNTSSRTIYAVFRIKGRKLPYRVSLGTDDVPTAINELARVRREATERLRPTANGLTLALVVEAYKRTLGGLGKNTREYRSYIIDKFVSAANAVFVKDLTPSFVEGWLARIMSEEGLGEDSYNKHLNVLRDFFKLVNRDCPLLVSPIAHLKAKRVPRGRMLIPTKEQAKNIIMQIAGQKRNAHALETADVVTFMSYAGVGNAEVENLQWVDISFDENAYQLHRQKTRQGPYRREMSPKIRELLLKRYEASDKKTNGRVFSINNPIKALKNACKKLGYPAFSPRSLRKGFITECMGLGIAVDVIARWQDHHDGGKLILNTYSHVTPDREKEALAKLE